MSQRLAALLEAIRTEAEGILTLSDGRYLAAVLATATAGYVAWSLLGRVARRGPVVTALRAPIALTVGLGGVLFVSFRLSAPVFGFLLVLLAFFWVVASLQLLTYLLVWLARRAVSPWTVDPERDGFHQVERSELSTRVSQEISRLEGDGVRALSIAAIGPRGTRGRRRTRRKIWQQAASSARGHYLLHRAKDGTLIVMLPDASPSELQRWLSHFRTPDLDAAVGWAVFPEDGRTVDRLLDFAVTSMWMEQGQEPGTVALSPAERSYIELGDADIVAYRDQRTAPPVPQLSTGSNF
jgi:hypothetical protein